MPNGREQYQEFKEAQRPSDDAFFTWLAKQGVTREQFNNLPVGAQARYQEQYQDSITTTDTTTTTTDTTPTGGNPWDNDSAFFEWFMGTYPNMDWDSLSEQQQNAYWTSYQQVTEETGGDDGTGDDGTGDDGTGADDPVDDGTGAEDPTKDQVDKETQIDPNEPTQVGDKWMDSAGNLWASYEEAFASNVRIRKAEEERSGRVADFERRFAEYEDLMKSGKAEDIALAQRQMARMKGQLERRIESSIFGMGGEIPE